MDRCLHAGAALMGAATLMLVAMTPADANVRRFNDSRTDESSFVGIRWVQVDNSTSSRDKVKVVTRVGEQPPPPDGSFGNEVFFDTKPRNPGPEYRLFSNQDVGLYRVDGWHDTGRFIPSSCAGSSPYGGYTARYLRTDNGVAVIVKRGCIGDPAKVRVAVHTSLGQWRPNAHDWASDTRTFLPWVLR